MSNENPSQGSNSRTFGIAFAGFAAGVIVAVVAIRAGANLGPMDTAGLAGTMVVRGGLPVAQDIAQLRLDEGSVSGTVAFARREDTVSAEFNIDSAEPIEVRLDLPDAGVAFGGVAEAGRPLPPATVQEGSISMTSKGERHFAVFLNQQGTDARSVKVSFLQNGQVIRQETIDLPAKIRG